MTKVLNLHLSGALVAQLTAIPGDRSILTLTDAYLADENRPIISLGFKGRGGSPTPHDRVRRGSIRSCPICFQRASYANTPPSAMASTPTGNSNFCKSWAKIFPAVWSPNSQPGMRLRIHRPGASSTRPHRMGPSSFLWRGCR